MQIDVYVLTAHKHAKARENKSVKKKLCIIDEKKKWMVIRSQIVW